MRVDYILRRSANEMNNLKVSHGITVEDSEEVVVLLDTLTPGEHVGKIYPESDGGQLGGAGDWSLTARLDRCRR